MQLESTLKNNLSNNLVRLRESRGLTQSTLADILQKEHDLKIMRSNIAAYETRAAVPKLEALYAFSRFFERSIDDLISNPDCLNSRVAMDVSEVDKWTNDFSKITAGFQFYKVLCARLFSVAQTIDLEPEDKKGKISFTERMMFAHREMFLRNSEDFQNTLKEILTPDEFMIYDATQKGQGFIEIATTLSRTEEVAISLFDNAKEKIKKYIYEQPL